MSEDNQIPTPNEAQPGTIRWGRVDPNGEGFYTMPDGDSSNDDTSAAEDPGSIPWNS